MPPTASVGQREHSQHGGARLDRARIPHRRLRRPHASLQREGRRVGVHPGGQPGLRAGVEVGRHGRLEALRGGAGRKRRRHHEVAQPRPLRLPHRILATPPVRGGRQQQWLVEQSARHAGPERGQTGAFEHAGPGHVGKYHLAGAQGLQQARNPERGVGAQLQRIEPFVVDTAQHHVHPFQALHRLQEHPAATHGEVAAFDQRDAQIDAPGTPARNRFHAADRASAARCGPAGRPGSVRAGRRAATRMMQPRAARSRRRKPRAAPARR